jgi:hypothetical protein
MSDTYTYITRTRLTSGRQPISFFQDLFLVSQTPPETPPHGTGAQSGAQPS